MVAGTAGIPINEYKLTGGAIVNLHWGRGRHLASRSSFVSLSYLLANWIDIQQLS